MVETTICIAGGGPSGLLLGLLLAKQGIDVTVLERLFHELLTQLFFSFFIFK